jgi:chromosome partitioning protein
MKIFLIANPKGGSGKSTLATNLAGYLASQEHDVMLGDIDRQQSSRAWLNARAFSLPPINSWDVGADQVSRPPRGTTHLVLDTPAGLHGKALERVMKLSTRILVPVLPSAFDMMATRHFLDLLQEQKAVRKGKIDVAIIGMRVDARTRAAVQLETFMDSLGFSVLTYLRTR